MEESRKGTAPGSSTKNSSASLDEDFGKDFLNSWKPSKFGKDSMDFDVEPIGGKNKKFNFGKLDDFDLGEDFGKLPSFKMDMSDLDFSSPVKKTGTKPSNEKSTKESFLGKKGQEKDKFSFTFDFDEFGKFDLDSPVPKEKKNTQNIQAQPTISNTSSNLDKNKAEKPNSNMDINTETLKNDTASKVPPKADTSKSHISTENINMAKHQSDNLSNTSNASRKINQVVTREESKEFSLPSISANSNSSRRFREVFDRSEKQERETNREVFDKTEKQERETNREVFDKTEKQERETNSVQSMGSSSHSRSASPVVSSANRDEIKEKDGQNQNNLAQHRNSDSDNSLSNNAPVPSAIHRDIRLVNSTQTKEKLSASLFYKPQQTSNLATKQASELTSKKIEGLNLLSSDLRRDSKKADEQNDISKTGLFTTVGKPSLKGALNDKIQPESRTFSILRGSTSSLLTNKGLMKDEKHALVSRLVKLNPRSPTPTLTTTSQDNNSKPSKSSERNNKASLSPQNKTPTAPVPIFPSKEREKEKPSFPSPSLKRKITEDSGPDPFIRNTLKRISSNSPVETRKSPEIIPKSPKMNSGNESPVGINNNLSISPLALPDFEMPVFLENNSNVERAEKISKDLDDICSMLKKKQEEAKELLVRAVVNNNKLLMLNHPLYDEKLRALESFASTLRTKHLIS